jgi:hypothetical protein
MKALYRTSLLAALFAATLSSCEKKSVELEKQSDKKTGIISQKVFPLDGNEMSTNILPRRDLPASKLTNYSGVKVKVIDSVCEDYVKGTTKLDFSKLKDGAFTYDIKDKKITVSSTTGFTKLNNGPKGWWTHWNYSPYTESEYPNVLFSQQENGYISNFLVLTLSKKVTTFGFEVAPNATGINLNVSVAYQEEDSRVEDEMFSVDQTVSSPSGARLIAVKSGTPFRKVTIYLGDYKPELQGLAISNIRYALAK